MSAQTTKTGIISANEAIWRRFQDLPRSQRDKLQAELESVGQWWHFKRFVTVAGNDLGNTNLRCMVIIGRPLSLTEKMMLDNQVDALQFNQFAPQLQVA